MVSGYYKYIVFDQIEKSTGKVYDQSCHKIMNRSCELPNTDWIVQNHWCVPLYYKGDEGQGIINFLYKKLNNKLARRAVWRVHNDALFRWQVTIDK